MKHSDYYHPYYPQASSRSDGELPPCLGFTLVESARLHHLHQRSRGATSPTRNPSPPLEPLFTFTLPDTQPRTPDERRRHLVNVLEAAAAILDDEDPSINDGIAYSSYAARARRTQGEQPEDEDAPKN